MSLVSNSLGLASGLAEKTKVQFYDHLSSD
jgi:hypothetical protein